MSSRCQHSRDDPAPRWLPSLLTADRLINNNNLSHTAQTTQLLKPLDLPEHFAPNSQGKVQQIFFSTKQSLIET